MAKFLMLFLFLAYCWGCGAQFTMTQLSSISASIGKTVDITCSRSSGSVDDYYTSWYQQKPSRPPIPLIYRDDTRASGIPERFSGSIDSSTNSATLTISEVQAEDEADYYCLSYDSNSQHIFGGGTNLAVTGLPTVPPSVTLFPPSQEEIRTKKQATIPCLLEGFYPANVQVTWLADGNPITSGVETTKPTKQGDKYVASSYLSLSEADWQRHDNYACKVTHEGQSFEKSVNRVESSS